MWNRTVTIELQVGGTLHVRNIRSTVEAAYCLLNGWPVRSGAQYKRAVISCRLALSGEIPDDLARFPFQTAARAADFTVKISNDLRQPDHLIAEIAEIAAETYSLDLQTYTVTLGCVSAP